MKKLLLSPLTAPVTKTIVIPGSKSYTNRALLLAALTKDTVLIKHALFSDDTAAMISCLKTLGIPVAIKGSDIVVSGSMCDVKKQDYTIHAGLSGTTIRFLLPVLCLVPGTKILTGDAGLLKRPIADLVEALRQLGAQIEYIEKEGFPPLRITSSTLSHHNVSVNGSVSSQYLSALLMVGPLIGLDITILGKLVSKPYVAMTIATLKQFGASIEENHGIYHIEKQNYATSRYVVEGDFSSAGYFFAVAALTKSTITLQNLSKESLQADKKLLDVLIQMGNTILYGDTEITIIGNGVKAMDIDVVEFPDQAQTLAVLAAFAKGKTVLFGIQSLRVKETQRVKALETELAKMGIKTVSTDTTLTIYGGEPKSAKIATYGDHRMAMAFAVAGSRLSGMEIEDPQVVTKTFPTFWEKLAEIGVGISGVEKKNIVLIGMRGSGKTTIAKLLAKKLNRAYVELDALLVKKVGMSIPDVVKTHGWEYFRNVESAIAQDAGEKTNAVISTGGGVILNPKNVSALKKQGIVIYLEAPMRTLLYRIGEDANRPLLTSSKSRQEEMESIFRDRKPLYENAADMRIQTQRKTRKQIVVEIMRQLEGENLWI